MNKQELIRRLKEHFPDYVYFEKDHGWREEYIKIRTPKTALLVKPYTRNIFHEEEIFDVYCRCFLCSLGKHREVSFNALVELLKLYENHKATPWPG